MTFDQSRRSFLAGAAATGLLATTGIRTAAAETANSSSGTKPRRLPPPTTEPSSVSKQSTKTPAREWCTLPEKRSELRM